MKDTLLFGNEDVLEYMKYNLIKDYPEGRIIIQVPQWINIQY